MEEMRMKIKNAIITITILFGCYLSASDSIVHNEILSYYSDSYNELRNKFLAAARLREGRIENYRNPENGPGDEALYIDIAYFGVNNPEAILVLGSGTHGVEGFAGSAIQTGLLRHDIVSTLPPHVGLLMIHAINPYGIAHLRRVNEDNIDLNRNFLDHSKPHPINKGYKYLANVLAPQSLSLWNDTTLLTKLLFYRFLHGTSELRSAVNGGQYTHPRGLFYGGNTSTWSNKTVNKIVRRHLIKAKRVVVIDFHTGLGSYGNAEIIMNVNKNSPAYKRARKWWGGLLTSTASGDSVSTHLSGTMKLAFDQMLPDSEVTAVSLEFGTLSRKKVLWALRDENWLYHYGGSEHTDSKKIKNNLLRAFYPNDKEWRLDIWRQSEKIVKQVIDQL